MATKFKEVYYQKPDDIEFQIHKLQFALAEFRRELTEKLGRSQIIDAQFDYLDQQAIRIQVAVSLSMGSKCG